MPAIRLILCRHTQTEYNVNRRITGQLDIPLNAEGERQADLVAAALEKFPIRAVVTSDLQRARTVAERIAQRHNLQTIADPRLREVHFGEVQGLSVEESRVRFPEPQYRGSRPAFDFRPVGGESHAQVLTRAVESINALADTFGWSNGAQPFVAVVGHGCLFTHLLKYFGIPDPLHAQGEFQMVEYTRPHA